MKIIVRVQLVTDWGEVSEVEIAEVPRPASGYESKNTALFIGRWQAERAIANFAESIEQHGAGERVSARRRRRPRGATPVHLPDSPLKHARIRCDPLSRTV